MTQAEIDALLVILNNVKRHMTVQDVHDEFGWTADYIRRICRKHGITLLSHTERNILYIKQVCHILTIDKIARNLDMNEAYIKRVADTAGIKLMDPVKPLFMRDRRITRDPEVLQAAKKLTL